MNTIAPRDGWYRFTSEEERTEYLIEHKLVTKTNPDKQLYYSTIYEDDPKTYPCKVIGHDSVMCVLKIENQLHCVHPDYLREMQPKPKSKH